jgi:hypothetical protein
MAVDTVSAPNYTYVFDFESDFEHMIYKPWMVANWWTVCAYASALYALLLLGGQAFMASRPRFEMRGPLVVWNVFLALFSIMGAARTLPELAHVLSTHGVYHSVCIPRYASSLRSLKLPTTRHSSHFIYANVTN